MEVTQSELSKEELDNAKKKVGLWPDHMFISLTACHAKLFGQSRRPHMVLI